MRKPVRTEKKPYISKEFGAYMVTISERRTTRQFYTCLRDGNFKSIKNNEEGD